MQAVAVTTLNLLTAIFNHKVTGRGGHVLSLNNHGSTWAGEAFQINAV